MEDFLLLRIPSAPQRGEFLELQARRATRAGLARDVGMASRRSNAALLPRDRGKTYYYYDRIITGAKPTRSVIP